MSVRILECPICNELFEAQLKKTYCSKECAKEAQRINKLKPHKFEDEELTPEYYEQYRKEAKEWKRRTDAYDADWLIRNQIVYPKPKCRCCGEILLVPYQKHYCNWSCYYDYHVKDKRFDKGEINV